MERGSSKRRRRPGRPSGFGVHLAMVSGWAMACGYLAVGCEDRAEPVWSPADTHDALQRLESLRDRRDSQINVPDGEGDWFRITSIQVDLPRTKPNGQPWDIGQGLPDPAVTISQAGRALSELGPFHDTTAHRFTPDNLAVDLSRGPIRVQVRDADVLADDAVGEATLDLGSGLWGASVSAEGSVVVALDLPLPPPQPLTTDNVDQRPQPVDDSPSSRMRVAETLSRPPGFEATAHRRTLLIRPFCRGDVADRITSRNGGDDRLAAAGFRRVECRNEQAQETRRGRLLHFDTVYYQRAVGSAEWTVEIVRTRQRPRPRPRRP